MDQNGSGDKDKKDQPKAQNDNPKSQSDGDKKDDQQKQQADAKSGKGEQPKPVEPAKKPSKGDATAANGEKPENAEAAGAAEERREPGQLTREEAKQLLDALKNDERQAPAISLQNRGAGQPNEKKITKDW
jgi:alpha-galactosidase/6-phospho-beta-glucosidase family protein